MSRFTVVISDVDAVFRSALSAEVEQLRVSTQSPGGCAVLSFTIREPISAALPVYLGAAYDVRLQDEQGTFWAGRMEEIAICRHRNAEFFQVHVLGYAAHLDDRIGLTENVSGQATNTVADNAVANHTQKIDSRDVDATGFTLQATTAITHTNKRVRELVNWAAQFGDSADKRILWHVWPDGTKNAFEFKIEPAAAGYFIRLADMSFFHAGFIFKNYANRIIVQYNAGASTETREDATAQGAGPDGVNVIRTHFVSIPEITQALDAQQAGDRLLNTMKTLRMHAQRITLPRGAVILDADRQEVSPWRVRAGKLVQIEDMSPYVGAGSNLAWNNSFLLVGTEWDEDSQELTLIPETWDPDISTIIAKARATKEARVE